MTSRPSADRDAAAHPLYTEFATGLWLGVIAALLVALPATWRAASSEAPLVYCWVALWGGAAFVLGPTAGALRLVRPLTGALAVLDGGQALTYV